MPKCRWSHCHHEGEEVSKENAVLIGRSTYYHPDCYAEKKAIEDIIEEYVNHYDPDPIFPHLRKVINNIVFNKGTSATYLLFCIRYAVENHITLHTPMGLYYLAKDYKIKEAWDRKQKVKAASEVNSISFEDAEGYGETQHYNYNTRSRGFGKILGSAT